MGKKIDDRSIHSPFVVKPQYEFESASREVIGVLIDVHRTLGPGFMESIYQDAVCVALSRRQIPFEAQKRISIQFEGVEIGLHYLDLVIRGQIVLELKAVKQLTETHCAQIRSYLRASGLRIGLLINFNEPVLKIRRFMN